MPVRDDLRNLLIQFEDRRIMAFPDAESTLNSLDALEQMVADGWRFSPPPTTITASAIGSEDIEVAITDEGDHLKLRIPLGEAQLRLNRYGDDPLYAEAIECAAGDIALDSGSGSPIIDHLDVPDGWKGQLEDAVLAYRAEHGHEVGRTE
jgi:hypothetical protein